MTITIIIMIISIYTDEKRKISMGIMQLQV